MARQVKISDVKRAMRRNEAWASEALKGAYHDEAQRIMRRSVRLAPVVTGALRASHFVALPEATARGIVQTLGYGASYAERVHEGWTFPVRQLTARARRAFFARLKAGLIRKSEVGGPKFLEKPMQEAKSGFEMRVARNAKRRLERQDFGLKGKSRSLEAAISGSRSE